MKAHEAEARGFQSTHTTDLSWNNKFAEERARLKAAGYKTLIVNERTSKYSRSNPSTAYRVLYVEERYYAEKEKARLRESLGRIEAQKAAALEKYQAELVQIEEARVRMEAKLAELENKGGN